MPQDSKSNPEYPKELQMPNADTPLPKPSEDTAKYYSDIARMSAIGLKDMVTKPQSEIDDMVSRASTIRHVTSRQLSTMPDEELIKYHNFVSSPYQAASYSQRGIGPDEMKFHRDRIRGELERRYNAGHSQGPVDLHQLSQEVNKQVPEEDSQPKGGYVLP